MEDVKCCVSKMETRMVTLALVKNQTLNLTKMENPVTKYIHATRRRTEVATNSVRRTVRKPSANVRFLTSNSTPTESPATKSTHARRQRKEDAHKRATRRETESNVRATTDIGWKPMGRLAPKFIHATRTAKQAAINFASERATTMNVDVTLVSN
jgi:hypothetical protein